MVAIGSPSRGAGANIALIVPHDVTETPRAVAAYGITAESREVKAGLPLNRKNMSAVRGSVPVCSPSGAYMRIMCRRIGSGEE